MKLLNIQQLSDLLNIKIKTIYDWTHKGEIPFIKVGRLLRFNNDDIEKWLRERKHPRPGRN
jgi:excisionase family DNA binding protein